ncbi:nickel pincer cofactor biosynthesis protein LarC [Methanobacterium spitsbergense]|uniref:Putative nickel insertion protein n=1 Tax=Methanobacterium spitsbergense TaxID=2874285 RepID=A0A8T5UU78_9EURY|nr:nickel pincer cofactor biosynthesis protein LarC [Methanobacterium spitsbergense]MBZ2164760.1 nickel pincer cofactor biosynthesis protein LarC [Methanobacterium spitsbergense]
MTVIIDPQNSGISGNMVIGALVDLGLDSEVVIEVMQYYASHFGDIDVNIEKVTKSGISASFVNVKCKDKKPLKYTDLIEVLDGIEHPEVSSDTIKSSKNVFKTLAEAEAKVHGTTIDEVHFHEVGAADAVADVIGAVYCYHKLGMKNEKVYGMPVALGGGRIKAMHGILSVPAPATLEILKNVPVFGGPVNFELTTPTGAALLVNFVDEFTNFYPLIINKNVGYGAGKMELSLPNTLRIIEGNSELESDRVSILETNLDNVTGELMGNIFNILMNKGARDVSIIPTLTKKNRPGYLLRVIAKPVDCDVLSELIIRETGTLGVRVIPFVHRNIASRKIVPVQFHINGIEVEIRIKVGMIGKDIISVKPEYEDVRKVSYERDMPLKEVMDRANQVFNEIYK